MQCFQLITINLSKVAHNPALIVPMGLRENNEPAGLTIIGKSSEQIL